MIVRPREGRNNHCNYRRKSEPFRLPRKTPGWNEIWSAGNTSFILVRRFCFKFYSSTTAKRKSTLKALHQTLQSTVFVGVFLLIDKKKLSRADSRAFCTKRGGVSNDPLWPRASNSSHLRLSLRRKKMVTNDWNERPKKCQNTCQSNNKEAYAPEIHYKVNAWQNLTSVQPKKWGFV